jgi:hypothetical protein
MQYLRGLQDIKLEDIPNIPSNDPSSSKTLAAEGEITNTQHG